MDFKITGTGSINNAAPVKKKDAKKPAGGFGSLIGGADDAEETAPATLSGVSTLQSLDSLLLAQEADDQTINRKHIQRGENLLKYMDEIRHGLLSGRISAGTVQRMLSEIRAERSEIQDPALKEVMDEIEVRAEVELAKLQAAQHNNQA